ncbi:MAG: hypothetical protein AB7N70_38675 [Dehalococcoidia bacterium]
MEKVLRTLRLIIEKADKLEGLRFTRHLLRGGFIGVSGKATDEGSVIQREGPDEDSIDAFVLTLRFFIQSNEPTSIANIENLFSALPLEPARVNAVKGTRRVLNERLDQWSHIVLKGQRLSRREIFEVFLWGGLAHANAAHKATYDSWAENDLGAMALQMEFTAILVDLLNVIFWFRQASREALSILQPGAPAA